MSPANVINYDEVIISGPGNVHPLRLPIASPQVSWELSAPGQFSGFIRIEDLRALNINTDLKGFWLQYASPAGAWGGIITGRPTSNGVAEIVAQGYAALLSGHVLSSSNLLMSGSAGGIARRVLIEAGAGSPTFVKIGTIDEGGGGLSMDLTGDAGNDLLPQIAESGDVEWYVDENRIFTLARRLGRDLSATVRLIEDRHIVEHRLNDDLFDDPSKPKMLLQSELSHAIMQLTAPVEPEPSVPSDNPPLPPPPSPGPYSGPGWYVIGGVHARIEGDWVNLPEGFPPGMEGGGQVAEAIYALQQQQTYVVESPGVASQPTTNAPPPTWSSFAIGISANNPSIPGIRHTSPPTIATELTLANVDQCFLAFGLGDTVRIDLGSIGVCGRFRAKVRALDVSSKTLTVSGELLKDL